MEGKNLWTSLELWAESCTVGTIGLHTFMVNMSAMVILGFKSLLWTVFCWKKVNYTYTTSKYPSASFTLSFRYFPLQTSVEGVEFGAGGFSFRWQLSSLTEQWHWCSGSFQFNAGQAFVLLGFFLNIWTNVLSVGLGFLPHQVASSPSNLDLVWNDHLGICSCFETVLIDRRLSQICTEHLGLSRVLCISQSKKLFLCWHRETTSCSQSSSLTGS